VGLSRDLLIRALAYDLQERTHGGASAALRRRLQSLAEASEKGVLAVDCCATKRMKTARQSG
jgi:hypothetical protein